MAASSQQIQPFLIGELKMLLRFVNHTGLNKDIVAIKSSIDDLSLVWSEAILVEDTAESEVRICRILPCSPIGSHVGAKNVACNILYRVTELWP